MKNKSAILRGVSTLALATTFFAQGAKAEVPVVVSSATTNSLSPAAAQAGTQASGQKTDAIVTSAASATGIGDANVSNLSVPTTTKNGILSKFTARVDEVYYGASLSASATRTNRTTYRRTPQATPCSSVPTSAWVIKSAQISSLALSTASTGCPRKGTTLCGKTPMFV